MEIHQVRSERPTRAHRRPRQRRPRTGRLTTARIRHRNSTNPDTPPRRGTTKPTPPSLAYRHTTPMDIKDGTNCLAEHRNCADTHAAATSSPGQTTTAHNTG